MDFVVIPLGLPISNHPKTYILSREKEGTWRQEGQEVLRLAQHRPQKSGAEPDEPQQGGIEADETESSFNVKY
jgi:hypothetical protein